jgi:hypothetical protein
MASSTLKKIVVITDISHLDTPDMISEAGGIVLTGDPDATAPPVPDVMLHADAAALQTIHNGRQTNPPTKTADEELVQRNIIVNKYKKDARYVQDVANDVAEAAGNVSAGEIVVQRIGMKLKKVASHNPRIFEVYKSGVGWVHLHTHAAAKRAAYAWRYGITTAKGTPPVTLGHPIINMEADILITGLPSGTIIGFQYGFVLPTHNPEHAHGTDAITYGDFIYFVIP